MPEKKTLERAKKDKQEGKSPSTQAGEFIKEQFDHIREGKHGARSPEQAIAIGLSEARRAGVKLPLPKKGKYSEEVTHKAEKDLEAGEHPHKPNPKRSRATEKALQKEGSHAASKSAISKHSKTAARNRTAEERHESAMKAVKTKGPKELSEAGKKAARTRKKKASR